MPQVARSSSVGTFTATLGTITAAASGTSNVIYYYYTSSTPIPITSNGFFTSVQIPDGTVPGIQLALFAASVTTNTAWEKQSNNIWYPFSDGTNSVECKTLYCNDTDSFR